ncbi:uncharacterized protein LOC127853670 isoform X1 [Dreissena polymorpha]|uniref:uncharacterized protein LOC127853670 isoform X1 n=1 Tax=Dreissena polymorpha TaxID=45954 RepID=UPI0022654CC4|nr:uncharacterized protein LOC127853670 isoform X1 [Dreissena polymorpha]XP_052244329.1 uncharacterized protein LOC127853670 isoform X1 [Dreissena polymorpha]
MAALLYCLPLTSPWLQAEENGEQVRVNECLRLLKDDRTPLVIMGEQNCGKTVLLFQAGVAYANQDYHVTAISRSPLSRMPLSVHGMIRPEAAGMLQTLTFLYMSKVSDLVAYCATLHTKPVLPDVLIVDDLDFYFNQLTEPSVEAGSARLCALLVDAAHFIKQKSSLGVLMCACGNYNNAWRHVLGQFKFTLADITADEKENEKYCVHVQTQTADVTVTYQVQTSAVMIKDVVFRRALSLNADMSVINK